MRAHTSILYNRRVVLVLMTAFLALSSEGAELVGRAAPEWPPRQWVQGGPLRLGDLRGKVVLLRFFMESECPLCRATAPSLNELYQDLGPRGLVVIGMYTPKPQPRAVALAEVRAHVQAYGFRFPVAVDGDWAALRKLWLDRVPAASFTSASLLIDRQGIVRRVHAGGAYAPDSRDYAELRSTIERLLAER